MEELLINENQTINIANGEVVEQVRAFVKVFSDALVKSKAYYNLLAAESVEAFLREKGLLQGEFVAMRASMKLLADFEIADIQLPNLSIDVRAVFDEDELFIPKKHFENKILPDIYLFVQMDDDLQNATLLGFVKPESVNLQNQNGEYYFVNKSILSPLSEFVNLVRKTGVKKQYVVSEQVEETIEKLIMLYMDNDIDSVKLEKLIEYLKNSVVVREKLIEFENFERLSSMAIQEFKDLDVQNNDFSKYIRALITTDEFADFAEDDFVEKPTQAVSSGLFIDDEEISNEIGVQEVNHNEENIEEQLFEENIEPESFIEKKEDDESAEVIEDFDFEVAGDTEDVFEEIKAVQEVSVVDEFDVFDSVDEFDIPVSNQEAVELLEDSVVNDEVEESALLGEELQGEDLELQMTQLSGLDEVLGREDDEAEIQEDFADITPDETLNVENSDAIDVQSEDLVNIEENQSNQDVQELEDNIIENQELQEIFEEPIVIEEQVQFDVAEDVISDALAEEIVEPEVNVEVSEDIDVAEQFVDEVVVNENVLDENLFSDDDNTGLDLDISMQENEIEIDIPDIVEKNDGEKLELSGVVEDISFEEESLGAIVDVVQDFSNVSFDEEQSDAQPLPEIVETVTDEDVDRAIAQTDFVAEEEDKVYSDDSLNMADDAGEFSLEELLVMENDLSFFEEENSNVEGVSAQSATSFVQSADGDEESNFVKAKTNAGLDEMFEETGGELELQEGTQVEEDENAFAFAVDNKSASQKNILVPIAALVTVIGLAGAGAWYFLSHGKSSPNNFDVADNSGVSDMTIDVNDVVPAENTLTTDISVSDNINSKQDATKVKDGVEVPSQLPSEEVKPLPEQLTMQKIKKDFSQPNTYLSVSKIVWDIPEYLTYNDDFASYLQSLGSSVKLNLSSDLLLVNENTIFNKVKVKIQLKDSGRKFSAELVDGCGAKVVDDLVLQSVKDTLNLLQPPVNSLDTADEDLFVTIYL